MFRKDKDKERKRPDLLFKNLEVSKKSSAAGSTFTEVIHIESRMKFICLANVMVGGTFMTPLLNPDGTPMLATKEEIYQLMREV
ncbi:MAG: hypothetical protein FWE21_00235 [Defluviitaleaceae bacterium]|nr:hypothetical protein [Defluviitaleaceae bacterium]